ncbi:FeoA family protein [Murdochiella massiliensis]|uniref:FeoA family protein n=1 Tax=Murdochiella massiliensis TaxID=1673723 RepID=UPI00082DF81D|nr:FeoA family protein [Murdochiella massiliensis]
MKLFLANPGEAYEITHIGGREKLQKQLMNLGFVPGSQIRLVNETQGNYIVVVKETRLGISRELAQKIDVAPVAESAQPFLLQARPCAEHEG